MSIKTATQVSFGLGLLSLLAVVVGHLALTDIYHGETDTSQEWRFLQVSAVIILAFHISALVTLWRLLRRPV
jgi:hypothetical protein